MELAKREDPAYRGRIAAAILRMVAARLKTYGPIDDKATCDSYMAAAQCRRVPIEAIGPAADWFASNHRGDFPCAAEFVDKALDLHDRAEIEARLESTKQEAKALDEARLQALQERYPEMDGSQFREIFQRSAEKILGPRMAKSLPQGERPEFVDLDKIALIEKQKQEMKSPPEA